MKFGDEMVKVIDALAEKFGIAIDWTSQNILPQVKELLADYSHYLMGTRALWIAIGITIIVLYILIVKRVYKEVRDDNYTGAKLFASETRYEIGLNDFGEFTLILGAILSGLSLIVIVFSANTLIKLAFCPEVAVLQQISQYL